MFINTIFAAGALASLASAIPLQQLKQRDVVWETQIKWDYVTIPVTSTVWVQPGETADAQPHGHHHKHTRTSHIKQTVTVSPSPVSPAESSSAYVAPAPSTPAAAATSTWAAPVPEQSEPAVAPSPTPSSPAPAPSSPAPAPSQGGGGGGSGGSPSGQTYTGDITYYTPGLGSCGQTSTDSDAIVALPHAMMEAQGAANPNLNPLCGKMITISYNGVQAQAEVVDTCPGCEGGSIDLSPSLFQQFASEAEGRVSGVEWWFS